MEAARSAFKERGYPATRVDDIAKAAGTSHGAFYLYFANKADILEALAVETSERMLELADELEGIELGPSGYDHIRTWVDTFVRSYAARRAGPQRLGPGGHRGPPLRQARPQPARPVRRTRSPGPSSAA